MRTFSLAFGLALGPLAVGCSGGNDGYVPIGGAIVTSPNEVLTVDIDTGQHLQTDAGKGTGVFVEYDPGGSWHIFTSCDSLTSGYSCGWDLVASIDPSLELGIADQSELGKDDSLLRVDQGSVRLVLDTSTGLNGARLTAPPSEQLTLDVVLDGVHDATYVNWIGDGAPRSNASADSDPIVFEPTSP